MVVSKVVILYIYFIHMVLELSRTFESFKIVDPSLEETICIPTYGKWVANENCIIKSNANPWMPNRKCWIRQHLYKECEIFFEELYVENIILKSIILGTTSGIIWNIIKA